MEYKIRNRILETVDQLKIIICFDKIEYIYNISISFVPIDFKVINSFFGFVLLAGF